MMHKSQPHKINKTSEGGAGQVPLVLIPGLICNAKLWAHQIQHLRKSREIQVIDHARAISLDSLVDEILRTFPMPFALAGHSMGGYVALHLMRRLIESDEPERVERLALISTSARQDTDEMAKRRRDFIALAKRGKFKGMSPMLMRTFIHKDRLLDDAVPKIIYEMVHDTGPEGFINQSEMILSRKDSCDILTDIKCPTAVICGIDDERTPLKLSEEMAERIPNAELLTIARCGHMPMLEQPLKTTKLMQRWLEMDPNLRKSTKKRRD